MKYVIIFLIVALFCQMIIHWPIRQEERGSAVIWRSSQERMDFYRLLRKHGQHKQMSLIAYDESKSYVVNRNGEKNLLFPLRDNSSDHARF